MYRHFDTDSFIKLNITNRANSLFIDDLKQFHSTLSERIDNKSVVVIGGAGTIGSSFIKAILKFNPSKLYVFDINENGLTELTRDLRSSTGYNIPVDYKTYPINFSDKIFEKIFRKEGGFDIVANFAAHKHVRSEKDEFSVEAMIENNVLKAKKLLDLLLEFPAERFFCVSTDKAANPVNLMGASKKLMEEVILAYSKLIPITTARFANVAFSNGSLLQGFIERLAKKQPLAAPNDVKRYFVSPEESGQLCLLACILGNSGEIFFPKLDAQKDTHTFAEIATLFLKEQGMESHVCNTEEEAREKVISFESDTPQYPVYFFKSDTSGEKAYEEFYTDTEQVDLNTFTALGVVKNALKKDIMEIELIFQKLNALFLSNELDKKAIVRLMSSIIPNFNHIETGKSLDQKM
jgi:FlaA1/EpsC-like NDP-sugar epimerase